jgi:Leucine-rich repeat (LRR) protein
MGGNHIYGNIPASFSHLSGLNLLNLSYNLLLGEIPPKIGRLEKLQVLLLGKNLISGSIPNSLGSQENLRIEYREVYCITFTKSYIVIYIHIRYIENKE